MSISMHNPYEDSESSKNWRRFVDVMLLSLLAHATIFTLVVLLPIFFPVPEFRMAKQASPTVSLSLMPPVPKKPLFIPTTPDANAPHKEQPVESANDAVLKSKSSLARAPDSIMPDVAGREHNPDLNSSPNIQTPPKPEVSSTPPTPKQAKPQKPTPPQPLQPQPLQPAPKPLPPTPQKKPPPPVDANGLPVLPPINAQTLAQENPSLVSPAPAVSMPQELTSVHGAISRGDSNSPAAMATELGKYKQYVHDVVGSYWYPDIDKHFGTIGVGMVHIQFTIHSDGTITDVIMLEGKDEILKTISKNALVAPGPYKAFSESMVKQVGDSYTDDFTFSVYGP